MHSKKLEVIILGLLVTIGFWLRFTKLEQIPPGFNWDEAAVAYNAYSLALTGKDEFGRSWPLFIESFGDYKTGLYSIWLTPVISNLGLSVFTARILNVLVGTSLILASYYLGKVWRPQSAVALILATLMTFSPLAIHLSRFVLEWYAALPLFLVGLAVMLGPGQPTWRWPLAASLLALSLYWYHSLRLFLPLFLLAYAVIYRRELLRHKKALVLGLISGLLSLLPLLTAVRDLPILARPQAVSLFGDDAVRRQQQEELYRATVLSWPGKRLVANKVVFYGYEVLTRYLAHFSPQFLFLGADATPRLSLPPLGKLPIISLPFLIIGVFVTITGKKQRDRLLLAWLLLAPLPASFSPDAPHGLRSLLLLPALHLLIATGLVWTFQQLQGKLRPTTWRLAELALIVVFALEFTRQAFYYYAFYPEASAAAWQVDQRELVHKLNAHQDRYDQVILSTHDGQPHIFVAFFTPLEPHYYQQALMVDSESSFNARISRLGKITFAEPQTTDYCLNNALLISKKPIPINNLSPIDVVQTPNRFHERKPSFYFYDTKQEELQEWCMQKHQAATLPY